MSHNPHTPPGQVQPVQNYSHLRPHHHAAYHGPQPAQMPPQYHQQQMPPRPIHVSPTGIWATKLTLRAISMVFCIVIIGIGASVHSDLNAVDYFFDSFTDDHNYFYPGPLLFLGPSATVAFVWSLAEAICICVRGGHRGIHPGACVGVDLILWLGFAGGSISMALAYTWIFSPYSTYQNPLIAFVFGIIEGVIHFALFVIACYETNVRNRRSTLVYFQPGTVNNNGAVMSTGAPPATMPYSTKEQPTRTMEPTVARKPLGPSPDTQAQAWGQHNELHTEPVRTPDTSSPPPFQAAASPVAPAAYHPN